MIFIYPSKLEGEPIEVYDISEPVTIEGWLVKSIPSYSPREVPPISIAVNGNLIDPELWSETTINPTDEMDITIEAKGLEWATIFIIASVVLSVASLAYAVIMRPQLPNQNQQNTRKGSKIDEANARGNKVRLGGTIREVSGHFKVYPDMLLPIHRYFTCTTEQRIDMLLVVGKGSYLIPPEKVKIGDTKFSSLTNSVTYTIYEPGDDLANDRSATWWHSAPEVGAPSTGGAGLELTTIYTAEITPTATSYSLDGFNVTANDGFFPDATWLVGTDIVIAEMLAYTVISDSDADIVVGDFTSLQPFVGMAIEIVGDNSGNYVVASVNSDSTEITLETDLGDPVTGLVSGIMGIGYRKLKYKITLVTFTDDDITGITIDRYTNENAIDESWTGFGTDTTSTLQISLFEPEFYGGWIGPFAVCPEGETTTAIEWDIYFPSGLVYISDDGSMLKKSVEVEIQFRDINIGGEWNSILKTYMAATLDQIGITVSVNVPDARYEFKARRVTVASSSTQVQDTVQLYGLRSRLCAPTRYEGITTMTVSLTAGKAISTQSEQLINLEVTRKLPVMEIDSDGNIYWSVNPQPTRGIIPWMSYIAKSIGYTDEDLDLISMKELDDLWSDRGDYFDTALESSSTVKAEILSCLKAGFAELTLDRGVMVPIRDQIRTVFDHMYTPQNMRKDSFTRQFGAKKPEEFDGVDVEYIDSDTWTKETVKCRLDGDLGIKVEKVVLEGVTDSTRAWRFGMRQRRSQKYRRWTYQFSTELDALNSRYLSYCALADDVPGYGQSAILLSVEQSSDDYVLESSEPFEWSSNETHVVGIRRQDGTLSGPYIATYVDPFHLSIADLDFTPDTTWDLEPPHLIFGTTTRWSYPVLIAEITPNADNTVDVAAANYDERVYADDDNFETTSSDSNLFICATKQRQPCVDLSFGCNGSVFATEGGIPPYEYFMKIGDGDWIPTTPDPPCAYSPEGCPGEIKYKVVDHIGNTVEVWFSHGSSPENVQIVGEIEVGTFMDFTYDYLPGGVGFEWASTSISIDAWTGEIGYIDPCLEEIGVTLILGGGECGTYEKTKTVTFTPLTISGPDAYTAGAYTASGGVAPYSFSTPTGCGMDVVTVTDYCGTTASMPVRMPTGQWVPVTIIPPIDPLTYPSGTIYSGQYRIINTFSSANNCCGCWKVGNCANCPVMDQWEWISGNIYTIRKYRYTQTNINICYLDPPGTTRGQDVYDYKNYTIEEWVCP